MLPRNTQEKQCFQSLEVLATAVAPKELFFVLAENQIQRIGKGGMLEPYRYFRSVAP